LMVNGSSAEQPRPASAKATMPRYGLPFGRKAVMSKAAPTTQGRTRQVRCSGNHRPMAAKTIRPAVTVPPKVVRARDARAVLAPRFCVMQREVQLAFIVLQMP